MHIVYKIYMYNTMIAKSMPEITHVYLFIEEISRDGKPFLVLSNIIYIICIRFRIVLNVSLNKIKIKKIKFGLNL